MTTKGIANWPLSTTALSTDTSRENACSFYCQKLESVANIVVADSTGVYLFSRSCLRKWGRQKM